MILNNNEAERGRWKSARHEVRNSIWEFFNM